MSNGTQDWLRGSADSGLKVTTSRLLEDAPEAMLLGQEAWCGLDNQVAALRVVEEPGEMASLVAACPAGPVGPGGRTVEVRVGPECRGSPRVLGTLKVRLTSLTRP